MDYNWGLPPSYPTVAITEPAPNPCAMVLNYAPTPVNVPDAYWVPNDSHSQWIGPNGGISVPYGWYIYRTSFVVPQAEAGFVHFALTVRGQFAADNALASIYLADLKPGSVSCQQLASYNYLNPNEYATWNKFEATSTVSPGTTAYLYFVVYNAPGNPAADNPSALRVQFAGSEFTPF